MKTNLPKGSRWTLLRRIDARFWSARCMCGTIKNVVLEHARSGASKSCGCLRAEVAKRLSTTHQQVNTRTYYSWSNMWTRCTNIKCDHYQMYGGRGIRIISRWKSFENFLADMGPKPEGRSLDRKNNNGNYCKSNCRWATPKQQANNKQNSLKNRSKA